jgi:hypothetical protein
MQSAAIKLLVVGFVVVAIVVFAAWDKSANYYPVEARVVKIDTRCYLKKSSGGKTTTTEEGSCKEARMLADSHPEYRGFKVHENHHVHVNYRAEGELRSRQGQLTMNRNTPKRGKEITILVRRDEPEKIRKK